MRQDAADAGAGEPLGPAAGLARLAARPCRHLDIDALDQIAEGGVVAVARLRQVDPDLADDAAGIGREDQHAVAHEHRFLDVVGDHQHALDRQLAFGPQVEEIGAQGLGGQHVERREGFVQHQDVGMHDQRAGKADALAHAARQLARIGGFEAVEADQVDRLQRTAADLGARQAERLEADLHVLQHGQPGKQREALEHHGDAGGRAADRPAEIADAAGGRWREAGDQPEQCRLARAGTAEQADDLAFVQGQVDAIQHQQFAAIGARKGLAQAANLQNGCRVHLVPPVR